jgi:hypothetical protein
MENWFDWFGYIPKTQTQNTQKFRDLNPNPKKQKSLIFSGENRFQSIIRHFFVNPSRNEFR